MPEFTITAVDPASPGAREILRDYYVDIVTRFNNRPATRREVDDAMRDESSEDLAGDTGLFVVATRRGSVIGCGGIRFVDRATGELTRVFVRADGRGTGTGTLLVEELESRARDKGLRTLRLDTRSDLVEARRLYTRLGYRPVDAFNQDPYAQHWFAKDLNAE